MSDKKSERLGWKTLEYRRVHAEIKRKRGSANRFQCSDCLNIAVDWSYIHNTNPIDIDNYEPRCRTCHYKYDNPNGQVKGELNTSSKLTEVDIQEIKKLYTTTGLSQEKIASSYGVSQSQISRILLGQQWCSTKQIERQGKTFKGKITKAQASEIRDLYERKGYTQKEIANLYGVNVKTVQLHLRKVCNAE